MPTVYFDTTVYDDIAKGDVAAEDIESVRRLATRGAIRAYPSLMNVEELLGQWDSERGEALRRIKILRDLVGFDNMLKQPRDLLDEAINAYAQWGITPPVTLARHHRDIVARNLDELLRGIAKTNVSNIVADVRALKDGFRRAMTETRDRVLTELKWESRPIEERRAVTFDQFFRNESQPWAEAFADGIGAGDACRRRGLDGLLNVRTVRICVGAQMSLVHSLVFGDGLQSRHSGWGEDYDLWHGLTASVAEIFVTGDHRLAQHLRRVPVANFVVVESLRQLLDHPRLA